MRATKSTSWFTRFAMSILAFNSGAGSGATRRNARSRGRAGAGGDSKYVDAETAQRLFRIMTPLLGAMEHSLGPHQVSIGIVADDAINAANGGGGKFLVTTGLLERANDEQLRGVMAHEIAHEDLGHVTELKISATGANMVLLEQLAAESSALTLIEGPLITLSFSRSEELQADQQSVAILKRAGHPKAVVIEALSWIVKNSAKAGGFVATHLDIGERIKILKAMPR